MCMYDLYLGASPVQEIPTRYHSYPSARVSLRLNFDRYRLLLLTLPPSLPPTRLVVATAAVCRYRGDSLYLSAGGHEVHLIMMSGMCVLFLSLKSKLTVDT